MNNLTYGTTAQQNDRQIDNESMRQGKIYDVSCNTHPHPLLAVDKQGGGISVENTQSTRIL